jgi:hypothetical protein
MFEVRFPTDLTENTVPLLLVTMGIAARVLTTEL